MIPLKLKIKNFLSYGSEFQEVDFEPFNLICLSGKNGHGKSGLLDAMTWAVWGQGRKVFGASKPDQGLLRLGQKNMAVIFDFLFNGYKYRVKREFTFTYGKPYAVLEFGLLDERTDQFVSLTDKTIKKTQEKMEELIGLDYETFVNTAFLRQGSSNEFSKKSAKDRKEILGNILGLGQYEILRKVAMEDSRKISVEKESLLKLQEHFEKEVAESAQLKDDLKQVSTQLVEVEKRQEEAKKQKTDLEAKLLKLKEEKAKQEMIANQVEKLSENFKKNFARFNETRLKWKKTHGSFLLHAAGDVELLRKELTEKLKELLKNKDLLMKKKQDYLETAKSAQELKSSLEIKWEKELNQKKLNVQRCSSEKLAAKTKLADLIQLISNYLKDKSEAETELKRLEAGIKNFDSEKLKILENWFDKAKSYYQQWVSQGNWVKAELKGLEAKTGTLINENPCCPVCEQMLSASRKKFLSAKFDKKTRFLIHRVNRLGALLKDLKPKLVEEHKKLTQLRAIQEKNKVEESKINEKRNNILKTMLLLREIELKQKEFEKENEKFYQQLKLAEESLSSWENGKAAYFEKDEKLKEFQVKLQELRLELEGIKYNESEHKTVEEKLSRLTEGSGDLNGIKQVKQQLFVQAIYQAAELRHEKVEIKTLENLKLKNLEADLKKLSDEQKLFEDIVEKISSEKDQLLKKQHQIQASINKIKEVEKKREEISKQIEKLETEIDELKIVATALGKDGVQALLIEEAIPEIEQEANNLLSRLTYNQSQVFIESLRDLKKGGTKETLDIKISDSAGIRDYEMFSGGEVFRIDFALRIAISKLLARRAGTSLQTLIIDEGFGSQDEEGLALVMDAIHRIQDDFAKVIVVSHLPVLKEQFPVHFLINKTATGSYVTVAQV